MLGDLLPGAGFGFSKLGLGKLGEVESLGKEEAAPLVGDLQKIFVFLKMAKEGVYGDVRAMCFRNIG